MLKIKHPVPTIAVVLLLILINLVALKWSWRFFQRQVDPVVLQYGASIPQLEGKGYFENNVDSVNHNVFNLVIYLSGSRLTGRSVSMLKFCELLRREDVGIQITLITAGILLEVKDLLQFNLVNYKVINDVNGLLAARLGLNPGDNGSFLFDNNGRCKFSVRQQMNVEDIRQLLDTEGITDAIAVKRKSLVKGKPLPSWSVIDARSMRPATLDQIGSPGTRLWVFFTFDCFSCGSPSSKRSIAEFDDWRKSAKKRALTEPILVFDSAFLRTEIIGELLKREIQWPVFISNEELDSLAWLARSRGISVDHPIIVRTDESGAVLSATIINSNKGLTSSTIAEPKKVKQAPETAAYDKVLQNLDLDIYDVASYGNLFCVSDRTKNSILILNEKYELQRMISGIGSAPDRLFRPGQIDVSSDGIIYVQDGGNERIQSFALDGTHIGGFNTTMYCGFAAGAGKEIYIGQPEKGNLVTVYSPTGQVLRSFGALKTFSEIYGSRFANKDDQYRIAINRVRLTVDREGNILVSFMLAPIIQKYTQQGELVFERRLDGPEMERLTAMFLSEGSESYLTMSIDGFPERIIALEAIARPNGEINIVLVDGTVYIADHEGHRLSVIRPVTNENFTPDMTGLAPSGNVILVGLSPRSCYILSRP